jgi:hypothetical protein
VVQIHHAVIKTGKIQMSEKTNDLMTLEECLASIDKSHREIIYWRKKFLNDRFIQDTYTKECFISMPCENMIRKNPEEHLIDCLNASLNFETKGL